MMPDASYGFYEFFAGGGMARLGLGAHWHCLLANEWSAKKASVYTEYFGRGTPKRCPELYEGDVACLTAAATPGLADLAWGSFPCQDLSLAGAGAGLNGDRSGTFRPFWRLMETLGLEGRAPRVIVLENVVGAITSHGGEDFREIFRRVVEAGYRVGPLVIDAVHFLPQSRPRLFFIAIHKSLHVVPGLVLPEPNGFWHTEALESARQSLPEDLRESWVWWRLPLPLRRRADLASLIEDEPTGTSWHSSAQTANLLAMMSELNRKKVSNAQQMRGRTIGTIYRRTRPTADGLRQQRAEVRFDGVAGCLRTPAGGSSRQIIMVVEGKRVRTRLLSSIEAARLMGIPENYPIPANYNDAYHLFGDGLVIPVVRHIEEHLLRPLIHTSAQAKAA